MPVSLCPMERLEGIVENGNDLRLSGAGRSSIVTFRGRVLCESEIKRPVN